MKLQGHRATLRNPEERAGRSVGSTVSHPLDIPIRSTSQSSRGTLQCIYILAASHHEPSTASSCLMQRRA